ncbi:hypothetical protein ACQVP2_07260 [Methylobacterium aquaticum]|uniref:hypothetical protein n=1 Tax=Methylobacterium aquaticum TaxID=270351 RepID=UPI003D17A605
MEAFWRRMMFGRARRAKFIVTALAFGAISCGPVSSKENLDRSNREAISLFDYIISTDRNYYKACTISDKWLVYSVFAETVRTYVNYPVRGDLSPPHHMTVPNDIIGKGAGEDPLICSETERSARKDAALSTSTQSGGGTFRERKIVASTRTAKREFSYPIFDTDYRTAFIVRDNSTRNWIKTEDGKCISFGDGEILVFIYRKRHGRWKMIGHDTYATYH